MMLTRSSEPTPIADAIGPILTTIAEAGDRQTVNRIGERERLDAEIRQPAPHTGRVPDIAREATA